MPDPSEPRRLSDDLRAVLAASEGRAMPVREILAHTHGRGLQTLAIILCLPFLSPVSVPFLSIPFGVAIAICGLRIALRHGPWLPEFVMRQCVPFRVLDAMLRFGIAFHGKLERFLRPRLVVLVDSHAALMGAGFCISLAAFFLSLPIPPPFPLTNTIPGIAIILLCLGTLERDGLLVLIGYTLTTIAAVYVTLIALVGKAGVEALWRWIFG
ncbi:MAG: exopolysaccharide biosynthesis protein [Terrimicrobiaceae bacterium]|nr:exopolysaccharide biosynthesis protein [Terrimicrobiaceae bacterium]